MHLKHWHHPQARNPLHAHSFFQQILNTPGRQASISELGIVRGGAQSARGGTLPGSELQARDPSRQLHSVDQNSPQGMC